MDVIFRNYECETRFSKYPNGNTAIELIGLAGHYYAHENIATATTNLGYVLPGNIVAIKDWSENEGMVNTLISAGIIHSNPIDIVPSGFVNVGFFKLKDDANKERMK